MKASWLGMSTLIALAITGCQEQAKDAAREEQATPRTFATARGTFTAPGVAYMDGRDPEASPPLTVMSVNVWSEPGFSRVRCQIGHGEQVDVLDAQRHPDHPDEWMAKVRHGGCEGWVFASFLNTRRTEPIGDRF